MEINVTKLTDVNLLRRANSFTTGHDSKMDLAHAYRYGHSPIRTQLFWIEMRDIPLFCASQFVRSHVGVQWYQLSKRTDRGGEDFITECNKVSKEICAQVHNIKDQIAQGMVTDTDDLYVPLGKLLEVARIVEEFTKRFDRYAPTDLACLINAEAIINMSHKRLCMKASKETREIWKMVLCELWNIDNDLFCFCVRPCVACGSCREPKPCGYIETDNYKICRKEYIKLFER